MVLRYAVFAGPLALVALAGCAPAHEAGEPVAYVMAERWCYETLAEIDCYIAPQPDAASRRVGWYDAVFVVE